VKYQNDWGQSQSGIAQHKFDYFVFADMSHESKQAEKIAGDPYLLGWVIDELDSLGYVTKNSASFFLTEEGLKIGTENVFQKWLRFLNKNPGLAIIISF